MSAEQDNTVFGIHAVEALIKQDIESVLVLKVTQGRDDKRLSRLLDYAGRQGVAMEFVPRKELDKLVRGRHQGVVALVKASPEQDEGDLENLLNALAEPPFLLILDSITDPHNLGACLRSADAAGVHAVIVPKDKSAPLNATARKVACGAAEHVPLIRVTNLARCMKWLQERGIWITGAAGEAEQDIYDTNLCGAMALAMGAEGAGLRRLTREHCDQLTRIPMAGSVSSLNVSVATGICLFEAVRQRQTNSAAK
ncbi:MAG: 23S rRNA (guanosine(2251)-2'-O)-methyltransferase RlmB [Oleiphilaceae bacterium]|nr:23S rRNA (guanosine(2251)-2'-O)-methyltransferase RlmB [Oleiphilaceae bacterium]